MSFGRGRTLFATPASEPRARRFTDVALLVGTSLSLWAAIAADVPPPGFVVAAALFLRSAPSFLDTVWQISVDLLALWAILLVVAAAVRRRVDVVRDVVVAVAVAAGVWLLATRHPSLRVSLASAIIVTAAPHLTRPVRRTGRWLVAFGCVGVTVLGDTSLLAGLAGVLVGTAAAAAVHLAFGSSAGRPALDDVRRALAQVGVEIRSLSPADRQPAGLFELTGVDSDGEPIVVKVYGRDAHDSALASTIWRSLWYREPGAPLRLGRLQQVEHEAFVTLLAAQFGVLTEAVATAGATDDDDAILVLRGRGTPLAEAANDRVLPHLASLVWDMVAQLHHGGIAHGRIDSTTVIVDGSRVGLVDFGDASVGASAGRMMHDRAQVLVATALLDGVDVAVAAAHDALGSAGLAEVLPYLQRSALTSLQRHQIKDAELDLDDLRGNAATAAGVEQPELQKLRRISIGAVLRVALPALAVLALSSAMAGLELEGVVDDIIHATWWLLALGFVLANLTRVSQAVSTLGASPTPIAFGPVYALQLAMGYLQIAIPSYAARVAVAVRFFQRQAIPAGAALAAGFLDVMTTFFIEVIGITCLLLFTPATLDLDLSGATSAAKKLSIIAGVIILVVALVVTVIRKLRRMVVDWAKRLGTEALAVLRGLHSPRRLALLLGGNLATEVLFTVALGTFARALGTTVPFADLLLIHLSVSLLAGLVPIPGGVGVVEALLTYGLIRSGMPDGPAFAAVICYRASTFYLPPTWGWFALHWLERNKHL
jgi:uncharacterized membrane protein YbhN (UPF0104 family)